MKRGFVSSTLTRSAMFCMVGTLYFTLFGGDGIGTFSALVSFTAVLVDLLLIAIFLTVGKKFPHILQVLCTISCTVEGCVAVIAGSSVNVKDTHSRTFLVRQFFICGGQIACLKLSFAIPKISLLRFPYLCMVIVGMLISEIICLVAILNASDSGGPGTLLLLVFSGSFNFVAIINSRQFEASDRHLYILMQNEKIRNKTMHEQIERTNKLGRTVLAMSEGSEGNDDVEDETAAADSSSSREDSDLVSEFDFWSRLTEKAEGDIASGAIPNFKALKESAVDMKSLESAMRLLRLKKGFRYFCNEESNLENLLFFEQVELFRGSFSKKATRLAKTFVISGAPSEVNISSKQRKKCADDVVGDTPVVSTQVFDEAQEEIRKVMNKDTFPRSVFQGPFLLSSPARRCAVVRSPPLPCLAPGSANPQSAWP